MTQWSKTRQVFNCACLMLLSLLLFAGALLSAAPAAGQVFTISNTPAPTAVAPGGTIRK